MWPAPRIFKEVIILWLVKTLQPGNEQRPRRDGHIRPSRANAHVATAASAVPRGRSRAAWKREPAFVPPHSRICSNPPIPSETSEHRPSLSIRATEAPDSRDAAAANS